MLKVQVMPSRYAFLVACNEYKNFDRLNFCVEDARLISETLTDWCDYLPENVIVEELSLTNPSSPDKIINDLETLVRKAEPGDTVMFFFAGHGAADKNDALLILPHSLGSELLSTSLPVSRISDTLKQSDLTCIRIFDACHSGVDVRDSGEASVDSSAFARALSSEKTTEHNWVTFASCLEDEKSFEDREVAHGIFTLCFSNSIREVEEDESVDALQLYGDVLARMEDICSQRMWSQHPVMNTSLSRRCEIAIRKPKSEPSAKATDIARTDLIPRLAAARSEKERLVRYRLEEIAAIPPIAAELFNKTAEVLIPLHIEYSQKTGSTDLIPNEWEPAIVRMFDKLGVRTLHTIEADVVEKNYFAFNLGQAHTSYTVNGRDWPQSVALLSWEGDDFIPSGRAMAYAIPLETKMYALVWLQVDSFIGNEDGIIYTLKSYVELDANWKRILKPAITEAMATCAERIRNSIAARLDYLDRERSKE